MNIYVIVGLSALFSGFFSYLAFSVNKDQWKLRPSVYTFAIQSLGKAFSLIIWFFGTMLSVITYLAIYDNFWSYHWFVTLLSALLALIALPAIIVIVTINANRLLYLLGILTFSFNKWAKNIERQAEQLQDNK